MAPRLRPLAPRDHGYWFTNEPGSQSRSWTGLWDGPAGSVEDVGVCALCWLLVYNTNIGVQGQLPQRLGRGASLEVELPLREQNREVEKQTTSRLLS